MPNDVLSFEEFCHRKDFHGAEIPTYHNFIWHFGAGGMVTEIYQTQAHYLRFVQEYPAPAALLVDEVRKLDPKQAWSQVTKPLERELYEAYKIMRSYGVTDQELFA